MLRPEVLKFTGVTISPQDIAEISNAHVTQIVRPEWARLHFVIPTTREAMDSVNKWLRENCKGQFSLYRFSSTRNYNEYRVVVRFADPNDAIVFKLSDGHRAWENK